eukprot:350897-Chlamydomonas_euryale.AAC.8
MGAAPPRKKAFFRIHADPSGLLCKGCCVDRPFHAPIQREHASVHANGRGKPCSSSCTRSACECV